jgi:hypothetical protein
MKPSLVLAHGLRDVLASSLLPWSYYSFRCAAHASSDVPEPAAVLPPGELAVSAASSMQSRTVAKVSLQEVGLESTMDAIMYKINIAIPSFI